MLYNTYFSDSFYLIEEYCEYGSLRSYLRQFRQNNGNYSEEGNGNGTNTSLDQQDTMITVKDLLAFSWQIAKGMSYLSDMKVILFL